MAEPLPRAELAAAAGATVVKAPEPAFWGGYSWYFADPDGFLWEAAHNPFSDLTEPPQWNGLPSWCARCDAEAHG